MNKLKMALLGLTALALFGCSSAPKTGLEAPVANTDTAREYKIGVGDQLTVNVWRNPELSLDVPVRPDGKISMPLVGDVQAAGLSASALSDALSKSLVNYIRNPQVAVIVTSATSTDYLSRIRVTGAVESPLSVPYRDGMTVLDVVLEAGGLTDFAVPNKAILYRRTEEGVKAYSVRLGDILNRGKLETNYSLTPSDIVTVPERSF